MVTIVPVSMDDETPQGEMLREHKDRVSGHPNFFGTLANSKAAFEAYMSAVWALSNGVLSDELRAQVALTASNEVGNPYCISAHRNQAQKFGVNPVESELNASGISSDSKTGLILEFVRKIVNNYGQVKASEIELLRAQGVTDEELLEIIANTVVAMASGIVNHVAGTEFETE